MADGTDAVNQLISRGITEGTDFLNSTLTYGTSELSHFIQDPSGYLQEQARKWDFGESDQSPLDPRYHQNKKK